jgi:hypothetical protein
MSTPTHTPDLTATPDLSPYAGHTPGPWEVIPENALTNASVRTIGGSWIATISYNRTGQTVGGIPIPTHESAANAALIVRAVNNHERLVAALDKLALSASLSGDWALKSSTVLDQARALLADLGKGGAK